ncbi:hypothetical protein SAMN05216266_102202 [Amycolatopsis marina]|uniref:Uncharacterized protein n=1 Tax=Amycolatopsis marina TaxID=490629 RepID=A0A1I0WVB6_9PSEU|nr:hypothetical protein [Amycolatopsis marina]SFA92080.1 hypothetical protein SAMN05216266_102202 [Amycolatopsis marina]
MDVEPGVVVDYVLHMVLRAPHLYLLTVAYWGLVAAVLVTRYVMKRRRVSELCMRALVVLGCVAIVLAFVDVAVRGQELIQISLVAYFATPLGVGRYFVRKWDGRAFAGWRGVAVREVTYVLAFLSFVALSVLDGNPWWFSRPEFDRTSALTIIENTNWLHSMATVFGLTALVEAVGLGGFRSKQGTTRKSG